MPISGGEVWAPIGAYGMPIQMEKLAKDGMTMLLVTHEVNFARTVASTTVFMRQGKIWESSPSQELFANPQTPELRNFVSAGSK